MIKAHRTPLVIGLGACLLILVLASIVSVPLPVSPDVKPDWVYDAGERIVSPPLVVDSLVMVQTTKSVRALDSSTGVLRWMVKGPVNADFSINQAYIVPMRSANGLLVTANGSAPILALSINTGDVVWEERPVTTNGEAVTDMQVSSNRAYVARYNAHLSAFDLGDGTLVWSSAVPARTRPRIILMNDQVVLIAGDRVEILDATSGTMLSEHRLDGLVDAALITGTTLYAALFNGAYSFEAFDLERSTYLWRIPRQASENSTPSNIRSITAGDETLYASGAGLIAMSAKDGQVFWVTKPNGSLGAALPEARGVYVRGDRFIYALDPQTGKVIGSIPIPQPLLSLHAVFPPPDLVVMSTRLVVAEGHSVMVISLSDR